MPLSEDEKLIWLGLKEPASDDTFSGSTPPTNSDGDELTTDDGSPLAGIRVHTEPGQSFDGIAVPAGTAEVFGRRVEVSQQTPVVESDQPPDTDPVTDPPTSGEYGPPGGDGTGVGDPAAQGIEFGTTLNAVDDLGLDDTGGTPINSGLQSAIADGTLVEFPAGEYLIEPTDNDGLGILVNGVTNFGMRGLDGQQRTDVKFQLPQGTGGKALTWGSGASKTYLANCVFDMSTDPGTNIQMVLNQNGDFYSYNTGHIGQTAPDQDANPGGEDLSLTAVSMGAGAEARIRNYQKTGKTLRLVDYPNNQITMQSPKSHAGTLAVVNAHMANGRSHSIYASRVQGAAQVLGGLFKNHTNTNMRLCGEGSFLKDATVLVDMDPAAAVETDTGDPQATRGVRWESGDVGKTGGYIENCEIIYTSQTGSCPGVLRIAGSAGGMEVRDTTIRNETTHSTVFIEAPGSGGTTPRKPWDVTFSNCAFEGAGTAPPVVNERDARTVTLENCTIDMPNAAQSRGVEKVGGS